MCVELNMPYCLLSVQLPPVVMWHDVSSVECLRVCPIIQGSNKVCDVLAARARVPRFPLESSFDRGVTHRVKRASLSLDAVSIRTDVFL